MKKVISFILVLVMLFTLSACASTSESSTDSDSSASDPSDTIVIKLPHAYPAGHPIADILENYFKPELERRSNGKIQVSLYPNAILATEEQIYEGLRNGTYEMGVIGNSFQDLVPAVTAMQLPFLFSDLSHAQKALIDEGYGSQLVDGVSDLGFDVKGILTAGFRIISSNRKLETLSDFNGLKLRMPNYENMVKLGTLLGCAVTPMSTSEIFSALEQGVIDAQENPASTIRTNGWYEVQKYILVTNHVFTPMYICTNNGFFNSLDEGTQNTLLEVIGETTQQIWDATKENDDANLEYMSSVVEVTYPSEELKADLREATTSMYADLYEVCPDVKAIVEAIQALE